MNDILFTQDTIHKRLSELANEITQKYHNKQLLLIGVLKGSFIFLADLQRTLYKNGCTDTEICFITVKSYFAGKISSKHPKIVTDIDCDVKGKHVLLIDDIFDTGNTLAYLSNVMKARRAASVASLVLLSKPARHEVMYRPTYIGFTITNQWVEGYGMDSAEKGRGNPDIIVRTNE